jgi:uncharacterized protein YbjT (DUF2867 family)
MQYNMTFSDLLQKDQLMSTLKVLVYGATGSQARPLVYKLIEQGHEVYVLTRHIEKAVDLKAAGAHIVVGALEDPASLRAASEGIDVVTLLIPAFLDNPLHAEQYGRNAIDAARAAGVKRVIWNMSGPLFPERTGNPLNDLRLDLLDYLRASKLAHITFETTVYIENLLGPWTTQGVLERNQVAYPIPVARKVGWLPSGDLAALMTAAIDRPELDGNHFKVSGLEAVTGPELAKLFSQVLKRDLTYYHMQPEEIGAVIDNLFGPGAGNDVADSYRREQNDPNPLPSYHDMSVVLDKLPVTMTRIIDWIAQHTSAFTLVAEEQK